jgi:hypothetical protein
MSSGACSACHGSKKCVECDGTGINPHLNESEPKCQACSGTGVCSMCNGTGFARAPQPEIFDPGFNKL